MSSVYNYRNGGEGFISWCNDNVWIPIYKSGETIPQWTPISDLPKKKNPETNKSPYEMWMKQQEVAVDCLRMDADGRFIHRLIVLCWPRGESKSFLVCMIQLWKFYCFPKQMIVLGANSKDQVKFVHFEVIKDIVKNSPNLVRIIGTKNIQEKEIRMRNKRGEVVSFIRPLSSFSGIVSNITGYTFSEIFAMKNPKFFSELHGSIRAVPNALGTIDSTVSSKNHFLFKQMYLPFVQKKDPTLYFSHRCSPTASIDDYWNPEMTQQQLDSYRSTLPNFEQFFINTWESLLMNRLCPLEAHNACKYKGVNNRLVIDASLVTHCKDILTLESRINNYTENMAANIRKYKTLLQNATEQKTKYERELDVFPELKANEFMPIEQIQEISDLYKTDFCLLCGLDRADPMKASVDTGARTMLTFTLKGMYNSRLLKNTYTEEIVMNYLYIPIGVFHVSDSLLSGIQEIMLEANSLFGIDKFCSERWGVWDMMEWLKENDIDAEIIHPTYERQKSCFTNLFEAINNGRFKMNLKNIHGYTGIDLFEEETMFFMHDIDKRRYISEQKLDVDGAQDDMIYSFGWGVYGGRDLNLEDFREITPKPFFGTYVKP